MREQAIVSVSATQLAYTRNNHKEIVLIISLPGLPLISSLLLANSHILI